MKVTIKNIVTAASLSLGLGFLAAVAINSFALMHLRVGGPVYENLKSRFDLLADILPPPQYIIEPYLEATRIRVDGRIGDHRERLNALYRDYTDRRTYWRDHATDTETSALLSEAWASADAFWAELDRRFLPAVERSDQTASAASYDALSRTYAAHRSAINRLVAHSNSQLESAQRSADSNNTMALAVVWTVSALLLMLLGGTLFVLITRLVKPILQFKEATRELSDGRLDTEIPAADRTDELGELAAAMAEFRNKLAAAERANAEQSHLIVDNIGKGLTEMASGNLAHRITATLTGPFAKLKDDFNTSIDHLQKMVSGIARCAVEIASNADEISTATHNLGRRTEQQAASLEQTSAALGEITENIRSGATQARQVDTSVNAANSAAQTGEKVVATATGTMGLIAASSKEIADIVGVIDEIAFQTNLLALNAGVEAARAGDAGKGFAVVASEVRDLAGRSAEAAKRIKTLIGTSNQHVADGVTHVEDAGQTLSGIAAQVQQVQAIVGHMTVATEQQSANLQEISHAISQMDKITQENAAMVEQSSAATRNLAGDAKTLQEMVQAFCTDHTAEPRRRYA